MLWGTEACEAVGHRVSFSYPLVYFVSLWDAGFQIARRDGDLWLSLAYVHLLKQSLLMLLICGSCCPRCCELNDLIVGLFVFNFCLSLT